MTSAHPERHSGEASEGIRFFGELAHAPVLLEDPEVIQGARVTHLRFRVRHRSA